MSTEEIINLEQHYLLGTYAARAVRAGSRRGVLGLRHGRQRLPRLRGGHRGERARPCRSRPGRRADGAGRQAVACLQPVSHGPPRPAGAEAVRNQLCRPGFLLQLRRGGRTRARSSSRASGPATSSVPKSTSSWRSATRSMGGRSARWPPRHARSTRRPSGRCCRACASRLSTIWQAAAEDDRRRRLRGDRGAGAGRGRRQPGNAGLSGRTARAVRPATTRC